MRIFIFVLFTAFIGHNSAIGQDTLLVSRETMIDRVLENNHQAKIAEMQAKMAHADLQKSNSLYLPQVTASYTGITTNNPLMAFGSKLNQEVLTPADFNPALLNDPDNIENFATEILVLQPLLNLDGVYGRSAASITKEAYELKSERYKEYLILEATKMYMQLQLAYEAVAVLERASATSKEAMKMVQDYYEQGMIQRADVLDVEVRASEVNAQLRYAYSNVRNTSDALAVLIGDQPGVLYQPTDPHINQEAKLSFSTELPSDRKDLRAMELSVQGYKNMLKSSQMKFLPRINAFGSFQLYDNQPLGFGANGYIVGAKLSWSLFNGYQNIANNTKAKIEAEKARTEQEQYTLQQQAELFKANRMLQDSQQKAETYRLALEQAQESYRTRKDRFEEGLEKTTDLLVAETQMFKKELEYRQAIFEFNFAREYLLFLTKN